MTEAEWNGCTDPQKMLEFLRGKASERKLRLFAAAAFRQIWLLLELEADRRAVEVAEQFADGEASEWELQNAREAVPEAFSVKGTVAWTNAYRAAWLACQDVYQLRCYAAQISRMSTRELICREEAAAQVALLRDLFGNPFRPLPAIDPTLLRWQDGTIPKLALAAYQKREWPSGALDKNCLAVLADALEEAGSNDEELLGHLRGPGPHVRGCWAVDLLLSKA